MNSINREESLQKMQEMQEKYVTKQLLDSTSNEAETRLLIIDEILILLGWSKSDFKPEHTVKKVGFIDYLITTDNTPRFIVEAKRIGKTFNHSRQKLQKTQYLLSYMRTAFGQSLTEVIDQAEGYSQETGVPFSVLTNGAEWLLIQTYGSGKSLNELNCFYFGNLLQDLSRFNLFWELLSKPYVLNGSLEENFSQINTVSAEFTLSPDSRIPEIQWKTERDSSQKHIRDFYDFFFGEIIDPGRRKMLKKCFVSNSRLNQYQRDLKRTLQDNAPSYIPNASDITPNYEDVEFLDSNTGDQKGKVILVIGSVGCGKSTFINKILIESKSDNSRNISLILDLINEFDGTSDTVNSYLWDLIDKEWKKQEPESYQYETLKKMFGRELKELKEGPYSKLFISQPELLIQKEAEKLEDLSSSPETFINRSWKYYIGNKREGIILFLDNIDRTSDNYQRFVYTFAHKIASRTGATVIITMREGTYFRGKTSGVLDVRSDDVVYHLQTPDRVEILSKRIDYVENLEKYSNNDEKDYRLSKWQKQSDWSEFRKSSLEFAATIKATFLTSNFSSQALGLLNATSWHNLRIFLTHLRELHIALGNAQEGWRVSYMISALATVNIDGENKAILPNLYLPIFREYPCYFLKIRIILRLLYGRQQSELRQGTRLNELLTFAKIYGYQERWSRLAIQQMVRERLLECMEIPTEKDFTKNYELPLQEEHTFRVAPLAVVMIEKIFCDKIYLLTIGRELPFQNEKLFQKYIDSVKDFFSTIQDLPFAQEGIGLFLETKAYRIVSRFLVEQSEREKPLYSSHFPEITNVEARLEIMMQELYKIAEMGIPKGLKNNSQKTFSRPTANQSVLFDISDYEKIDSSQSKTEIPLEFTYSNSTASRLPPKIFWALVELNAREKEWVTGAEITRIINQYLVDDLNHVESTNISKALRGKELKSEEWLERKNIQSQKTLYRICNNWTDYWFNFFKDSPPPTR